MTLSPYAPPTTASENEQSPEFDGDPLDNPRILVWALRVATLLLIPLGLLGSLGAFTVLTGDPDNTDAYQGTIASIYAWVLSIPVLTVCLLVYRKCYRNISRADRFWLYSWSVLPTVALVVAFAAYDVRY